jgi:hypothetical protein
MAFEEIEIDVEIDVASGHAFFRTDSIVPTPSLCFQRGLQTLP